MGISTLTVTASPNLQDQDRDPARDPQPGDCLRRPGANFRPLFRYVLRREETRVSFCTGFGSAIKDVWLSSWQDWSAGADVCQNADTAAAPLLPIEEFFAKMLQADRTSRRTKPE